MGVDYVVWKQSSDYLYGWQWKHKDGSVGDGYRTRKAAIAAAAEDAECLAETGKHAKDILFARLHR